MTSTKTLLVNTSYVKSMVDFLFTNSLPIRDKPPIFLAYHRHRITSALKTPCSILLNSSLKEKNLEGRIADMRSAANRRSFLTKGLTLGTATVGAGYRSRAIVVDCKGK